MRDRFHEQLQQLSEALITMGALCEEAISDAAKSYFTGDRRLGERAGQLEQQIDQQQRDIESLCMQLLLRQQPVARDLRTISAAMRMISDMERIGDQAADIAEIARDVQAGKQSDELQQIPDSYQSQQVDKGRKSVFMSRLRRLSPIGCSGSIPNRSLRTDIGRSRGIGMCHSFYVLSSV